MSRYIDQSALLRQTGPTVRPLQGLPPNKHGSSVSLPLGATNVTLVDARTESNDAEMIAVAIGVEANGPSRIVGELVDLSATVTWGIGGANFQATIDLMNGTVFSLPANYVRIDASHGGTTGIGGLSTVFQASAGVAYGTFTPNNGIGPQRTVLGGLVPIGGAVVFAVPKFATSFTVFASGSGGTTLPPAGIEIWEQGLSGTMYAVYGINSFSNSANLIQSFPIINPASTIRVINGTGIALTNCGVIFSLTL